MATKIAVRGDLFTAPDDMAGITWLDVEPSADDLALGVLPDDERDYFNMRRIQKLERDHAKREHVAKVRASVPAELSTLATVGHRLTVMGASHVYASHKPGYAPKMYAGTPGAPLEVLTMAHGVARVTHTVTETRMTARGQDTITARRGEMIQSADVETLLSKVIELAREDISSGYGVSLIVETGKPSRKKWEMKASRLNRHDSNVNKELARHASIQAMATARGEIESMLAKGEPVPNKLWKQALGRSLTVTEMKATKRQRDGVSRESYGTYAGKESAMARMLNSLERK